jgi:hypothetical protein
MRRKMTKPVDCCADKTAVAQTHNQTVPAVIRAWISTPLGMTVAGIAVAAVGLALNWSWLVAVGAAPLILSFAPCAAICALGLCVNMQGGSAPPTDAARGDSAPQSPTPVQLETAPKAS